MSPTDPAAIALHPSAWVFVVLSLAGAVLAVTVRNVLRAILCLAVTLMGLAALPAPVHTGAGSAAEGYLSGAGGCVVE